MKSKRIGLAVLAAVCVSVAIGGSVMLGHDHESDGVQASTGFSGMEWVSVGREDAPVIALVVVEPSCEPCRLAMADVSSLVRSGRGRLLVSVVGTSEAAQTIVAMKADGIAQWYGFYEFDSGKTIEKADVDAARAVLEANNRAFGDVGLEGTPAIIVPQAGGGQSSLFVGAGNREWIELATRNALSGT